MGYLGKPDCVIHWEAYNSFSFKFENKAKDRFVMFHISKAMCLHSCGFHLRQSAKRK